MKREIPLGLSVYLDLVRFGAASVVFFFMLSGFVISHAALPFFGLLLLGVVGMGELTERRTNWYRSLLAPLFAGRRGAVPVGR
ncbi:hypothetical protein GCM10025794_15430 [Massilia kyonggiensis]|nr:hypothetical protein [Massilia kyonggiensis]